MLFAAGLLLLLAGVAAALAYSCSHPLDRSTIAPVPSRYRIDVNTADAATLTLLPGVGPTTAERIVEDRERNGPYRTLEDLERVPRIGPKTVQRMAAYVEFKPKPMALD